MLDGSGEEPRLSSLAQLHASSSNSMPRLRRVTLRTRNSKGYRPRGIRPPARTQTGDLRFQIRKSDERWVVKICWRVELNMIAGATPKLAILRPRRSIRMTRRDAWGLLEPERDEASSGGKHRSPRLQNKPHGPPGTGAKGQRSPPAQCEGRERRAL